MRGTDAAPHDSALTRGGSVVAARNRRAYRPSSASWARVRLAVSSGGSSLVRPGYVMNRGEVIGTIGNADGKYHAHLHFEMRTKPGKDIGCGYAGDTLGFVDPTAFIEAHRPPRSP